MAKQTKTPLDIHDWIERLRAAGELHEITQEVDPELEITEITDRVTKENGPALLFTNVRGSSMPVLTNQFGSDRRLAMAFGVDDISEIGDRITDLLQMVRPPKTFKAKRDVLAKVTKLARSVPPKIVKKAACQEVVHTGDAVDLDEIPILKCWPEDGGRFVTLPMVFTKDEKGVRNCGMYRVQQFDKNTCGMHWQIHKDAADTWRHMPENGRLEVAVAIGSDPILTYAASCPLPSDIDEMLFAGFARERRVEMVQCKTVDVQVPANSEIVLEGYIDQGELRTEGPFGDHTGYYSLADEYPVFHVTAITHRQNPVYSATIVGIPNHEDKWMGKATERIFLPLLQMVQHEILDYALPTEGVFHGCCIVRLKKRFPGHARKAMHAIWGTALLSLTKSVIVVDEDVDVHDYMAVAKRVAQEWDPRLDTARAEGPIDVLDHAPNRMGLGGKIGIDATRTWPSERAGVETAAFDPLGVDEHNQLLGELASIEGVTSSHILHEAALAIVAIDKQRPFQARELIEKVVGLDHADKLRMVIVTDDYVDTADYGEVAFRTFGNTDPARDVRIPADSASLLAVDATTKLASEGYERDWPADIIMTEAIKQMVDDNWAAYGIPTPGNRTKPLQGLAEGERRIAPTDTARGAEGSGNAEMARDGLATALRS